MKTRHAHPTPQIPTARCSDFCEKAARTIFLKWLARHAGPLGPPIPLTFRVAASPALLLGPSPSTPQTPSPRPQHPATPLQCPPARLTSAAPSLHRLTTAKSGPGPESASPGSLPCQQKAIVGPDLCSRSRWHHPSCTGGPLLYSSPLQ